VVLLLCLLCFCCVLVFGDFVVLVVLMFGFSRFVLVCHSLSLFVFGRFEYGWWF